jgi:septal ring factor EnvC (AmiA/AmiB activator)
MTVAGEETGDHDGDDNPVETEPDPDVYLLINKIQNDIAEHEALVARIHRRDAEYERMKKGYEQKLSVLQSQMSQFQSERDLALSKISGGSKLKAKSKFDEEKRQLDTQIAEYKRKIGENSRMQNNNRTRSDQLAKDLQATIESLKSNL